MITVPHTVTLQNIAHTGFSNITIFLGVHSVIPAHMSAARQQTNDKIILINNY